MSIEYRCDRCRYRIDKSKVHELYTENPDAFGDDERYRIDLCPDCFSMFEAVFVYGVKEDGW